MFLKYPLSKNVSPFLLNKLYYLDLKRNKITLFKIIIVPF